MFKARVAVAATPEKEKNIFDLCTQFEVHANQISKWRTQLISLATEVFGGIAEMQQVELNPLHAKIDWVAFESN